MVALRAQEAGAAGGGAAVTSTPTVGISVKEASSFGPAVDQGYKSLTEMREERQVHPNMESVFRRTYSSPSTLPSTSFFFGPFFCIWLMKLHLKDVCDCDSRPLFLDPLFLPLYVHIHIYI